MQAVCAANTAVKSPPGTGVTGMSKRQRCGGVAWEVRCGGLGSMSNQRMAACGASGSTGLGGAVGGKRNRQQATTVRMVGVNKVGWEERGWGVVG